MRSGVRIARVWGLLCATLAAGGATLAAGGASAAAAGPPAELRAEIDGRSTLVAVDASGAVVFQIGQGRRGERFPPRGAEAGRGGDPGPEGERELASAELEVGEGERFGGGAVVVARLDFRREDGSPAGEAAAFAIRDGGVSELWRGDAGPQGRDGEWSIAVRASDGGLIRYQRKVGVRRCDGREPRLFLERFDFERGAFRPASEPPRAPDAPALRVETEPPDEALADARGVAFRAASASSQRGAASARALAPPLAIDDGDPDTAWIDGATGFGRGEFITLQSRLGGAEVVGLRVVPGHGASGEAFRDYNRVKELEVWLGDRPFRAAIPSDPADRGPAPYYAMLPEPVETDCVTAVLREAYPGRRAPAPGRGSTALGELTVLTSLDLEPGGAERALAERAVAGGARGARAARFLARGGEEAAAAAASVLAETEDPRARRRLLEALSAIGHPAGAEALAGELRGEDDGDAAEKRAEALGDMGEDGTDALADVVASEAAPRPARAAAADALAGIESERALAALTDAAAAADGALGAAIAEALGRRPAGDLEALTRAAGEAEPGPGRVALWRGVGELAASAPATAGRGEAAEKLAHELAAAEGYEARYRLAAAAAAVPEEAALAAVADVLAEGGAPPGARAEPPAARAEATAVRRAAVTSMARNSSPRAGELLARAARDADPGVRRRAVSGLAGREGGPRAADLVAVLRADGWPRIRRAAAGALAEACGDAALAALDGAVEEDPDAGVQTEALASLATCRPARAAERSATLAGDRSRAPALRARAAAIMGRLGGPGASGELIDLLETERARAWEDEGALEVAIAAAYALGELGAADSVNPLADAAGETAFPTLQAAAVAALGEICPIGSRQLFTELIEGGEARVAAAARAALAQCRE